MLCRDCEEVRFPFMKTIKSRQAKEPLMTTRQSTRSRGRLNQTDSKGAECAKIVSVRNSSVASDGESSPGLCPRCHEPTDKTCVLCDICHDSYHCLCTGLSSEVYNILISIVKDVGWVCADCRVAGSSKLVSLQGSLARTTEEIALLRTLITDLKGELDSIKPVTTALTTCSLQTPPDSSPPLPTDASNAGSHLSSSARISEHRMEISKVLQDITRRKNNIIITGLPETPALSESESRAADRDSFLRLCEEHLDVKPSVSHLGCRRLGKLKDHDNRPRKLLVHLTSEAAATSIIQSAKLLRRSDDLFLASHVYINPDLSPSDARLAFEKRQRKRERRKGECDSRVNRDDAAAAGSSSDIRDVGGDVTVVDQPVTFLPKSETDSMTVHHAVTASSINNTVTVVQPGSASGISTMSLSTALPTTEAALTMSSSSAYSSGTLALSDTTSNTASYALSSAGTVSLSTAPSGNSSATSSSTSSTGMPFQ